jgi:predicted helicase
MSLSLKPNHATVKAYYETLHQFGQLYIDHEGAVRSAFQTLLAKCGQRATPKLTLVPEYRIERARSSVIVDGALVDLYHLPHGYWEAKDEKDDLIREVERKLAKGYPRDNIIFQAPERAILYQGGARIFDEDIKQPEALVSIVNALFDYKAPHIQEWEQAVGDFSDRIPELAAAVKKTIDVERKRNPSFVRSFDDFYALCRLAINPNLSEEAVERMLVQHLLTERIFRKIFNNPDFTRRNVVAAEIEKVISELTKRSLNRDEFLGSLERFYRAIERSAEETTNFSEKQAFLNKVYERFFQGYSPKEADTHGIVYTPQPIVNFMVRSIEEILKKEFSRSLGDKGVHILDPFVGTGNFIIRIMQEIRTTDLPYKYENELHCNEVMLLPYYIASMNIEHAYFDRAGEYKAFPGICLVDTFELAESKQVPMFTEKNTERVERQKQQQIFVIVGNPPYNAWQLDENDNNGNRSYPAMDKRVTETYARDSKAQNKNALRDPYIKAIRWASDRIGSEGVIALVTNSGFIDSIGADGMRQHLTQQFDGIYILDLGGNVRRNPKLSGTTHNVFGIKPGVSINLLVRRSIRTGHTCTVHYARVEEYWRREQKYQYLDEKGSCGAVAWQTLTPDSKNNWLTAGLLSEFDTFLSISSVFSVDSNGLKTNRDEWAYNFDRGVLAANIARTAETYNQETARWARRTEKKQSLDEFLTSDEKQISWSETLKKHLEAGDYATADETRIRRALYRPFCAQYVYFDELWNERQYQLGSIFPLGTPGENEALWCKVGSDWPFFPLAVNLVPDVLPQGGSRCFPFYTYTEDGTNRRENITDSALEIFRVRYGDNTITKQNIFHYIYAVLHHPEYRLRYAANLRRELPRIPFASASGVPSAMKDSELFKSLAKAGHHLAEIHVHYEQQPEYPLTKSEKSGEKLDYRIARMRLSKDKTSLIYNQLLTLSDIPKETFEYRLGNRSALEWVIDQYQASTDKRSGITNDPNRDDDPTYILRLIGQVITVSLETVKIVGSLSSLGLTDSESAVPATAATE